MFSLSIYLISHLKITLIIKSEIKIINKIIPVNLTVLLLFLFIFHSVFIKSEFRPQLLATVRIRIVADCGLLSCQVTRKLKRAITLEFTTETAIIFIHCACCTS